jgi:preprotein translocase subunit SecD
LKPLKYRLGIVLAVVAAAVVYILPTLHMAATEQKTPQLWPKKGINLGLDLQGGMHLVLEVQTEQAVENTLERTAEEIRDRTRSERIRNVKTAMVDEKTMRIEVQGDSNIEAFNELFDEEFRNLRIQARSRSDDRLTLETDLPEREADSIKKMAVDQALETIRNRVDEFGTTEPDIRRQGDKRILVQLPGVDDPQRAKDLIGRTALLEFKLLDEAHDPAKAEKTGRVPPGSELLYQVREDPQTNRTTRTPYLVKKRSPLTGANLADARVMIDSQYNEPYVTLRFDNKGTRDFARITRENVKKRLAIVLDEKVHSAPVIQEPITGGEARITGNFTMEEARDLAIVLRAGALPAEVKILEERTVGPSLGADSIRMGLISMLVGGAIVIVFMIIYYNFSGVIADLALLLNILIIAAGLAAFQATLTLPGIAGIILTIGMAVDANVLIFERIREESHLGKSPQSAVNAGFDRATLTILDANVTTLIAALVLFQFGTGPVKGFAVTLSLGVMASMFTALVVSRLIFDYLLMSRRMKTLSI